jgi:anti-anti-sigma regulatory factor
MKIYLIVTKGKHAGLPIPITVDLFVIGTDRSCQLRSTRPGVGGQHCAIVTRERKIFIRDLNSGNGTFINGEAMPAGEEWPLHAGDRIAVSDHEFMIQFHEKPLSQKDLEEWALRCLDADSNRKATALEELEGVQSYTKKYASAANAAGAIIERMSTMRGVVRGQLRISREQHITHVRINVTNLVEEGELALLKKELNDQLNLPNLYILLDFKVVKRMSSTAVEIIHEMVGRWRKNGCKVAICRLRPDLLEALQEVGLSGVTIFNDKDEALRSKW